MFRKFSSSRIEINDNAVSSAEQCLSDSPSNPASEATINESKQPLLPANKRRTSLPSRRQLKSALYFACWPTILATLLILSSSNQSTFVQAFATANNKSALNQRRHDWIGKSVQYYSTVMRKNVGNEYKIDLQQTTSTNLLLEQDDNEAIIDPAFVELATKHYHARFLIKKGKWSSAEKLYRRIIAELQSEEQCDNTKLAVSTLLLALHMQRTGDIKATRAVFLNFFRRITLEEEDEEEECTCSAKVLQAYALFEMKNGHSAKSLEIIRRAVRMDEGLSPVLAWKQFRDAAEGKRYRPTFSFRGQETAKE